MWRICRIDTDPWTGETTYFEVQGAYHKRDLDMNAARKSGFVGPDDRLVIVGPDGRLR